MFDDKEATAVPLLSSVNDDDDYYNDDDNLDKNNSPVLFAEDTPAYAVLQEYNLLNTQYRKNSFEDIFTEMDLSPNSSKSQTFAKRCQWGVYCIPCFGLIAYVSLENRNRWIRISIFGMYVCMDN